MMATGTDHIQGLWADLLLPLNDDLSVNTKKLYTHVQTLAAKGVAGLVLFGRMGEGWSFSASERAHVVHELIHQGIAGQDILLNAGTANFSDTVRLIQETQALGVKRFMLMPPVMEPDSTDQGLVDFFSQTLRQLGGVNANFYLSSPISSNAGDFNNRVISEVLGKHPKLFRGLIDQSPNASHTLDWIRSFSSQLSVYTSHDMNAQVVAGMGTHTCISAYANILTRLMFKTINANNAQQKVAVSGNKIDEDTSRLNEFDQWFAHLPRVPALKFLLSLHDHDPDWMRVRPPLSPLAADAQEKLAKAFKKMSLHPNVF